MRRRNDDMRFTTALCFEKFVENPLARRDSLDGIGAAKQLIDQEQMRTITAAGSNQREQRLDFD